MSTSYIIVSSLVGLVLYYISYRIAHRAERKALREKCKTCFFSSEVAQYAAHSVCEECEKGDQYEEDDGFYVPKWFEDELQRSKEKTTRSF